MSDMAPIIAKPNPVNPIQDTALRPETPTQPRQNQEQQQRSVILSIDMSNLQMDQKKIAEKDKEQEILSKKEELLRDVKTVSVSYETSGIAVVKFLDSKGNTVLQVPPEEYLRMKEKAKEEDTLNIPDIVNKKV